MSLIHGYKVIKKLAHTNISQIILVKKSNKYFIIKMPTSSTYNERIRFEYHMLSYLGFDFLPKPVELYERKRKSILIKEYIDGVHLDEYLAGKDISEIRRYFKIIVGYIFEFHKKGIVLNDLSPKNILVERETGKPYIIDIGNAFFYFKSEPINIVNMPYTAPSAIEGEPEFKSDIYSLAMIFHSIVLGHPAIQAQNPDELYKSQKKLYVDTEIYGKEKKFGEIIKKSLSFFQEQRPSAFHILNTLGYNKLSIFSISDAVSLVPLNLDTYVKNNNSIINIITGAFDDNVKRYLSKYLNIILNIKGKRSALINETGSIPPGCDIAIYYADNMQEKELKTLHENIFFQPDLKMLMNALLNEDIHKIIIVSTNSVGIQNIYPYVKELRLSLISFPLLKRILKIIDIELVNFTEVFEQLLKDSSSFLSRFIAYLNFGLHYLSSIGKCKNNSIEIDFEACRKLKEQAKANRDLEKYLSGYGIVIPFEFLKNSTQLTKIPPLIFRLIANGNVLVENEEIMLTKPVGGGKDMESSEAIIKILEAKYPECDELCTAELIFQYMRTEDKKRQKKALNIFDNFITDKSIKGLILEKSVHFASDRDILLEIIKRKIKTGLLASALHDLEGLHIKFANDTEINYLTGSILTSLGRYEEAVEYLKDTQTIKAQRLLALCYELLHKPIEQSDVLKLLSSSDIYNRYYKAVKLIQSRKYSRAQKILLSLLRKAYGKEEGKFFIKLSLNSLAYIYILLNKLDSAIEFLKQSLHYSTTYHLDTQTYIYMGYAFLKKRDRNNATEMFTKAMLYNSLAGDNVFDSYIKSTLASIYKKEGEWKISVEYSKKILGKGVTDKYFITSLNSLSEIYIKSHRYREFEKLCQKYGKYMEDSYLCEYYIETEQFAKAREIMGKITTRGENKKFYYLVNLYKIKHPGGGKQWKMK